jgi:ribosomal-protein-alanine N-acetyltransferase
VSTPVLHTERLLLRGWRPEDREPFAALNADPRVMEHMPALLPRAQSDALARHSEQHFATHGFGPWAVEVPGVAPFIGFVGLVVPAFEAHFTPCVEIGWRLSAGHWGHGYATEAALASARHAFDTVGLEQLVSFTAQQNLRSQAVMRRIGMTHDAADDFDHPRLPPGHRLRRHVLYRLTRAVHRNEGVRGTLDP